MVVGAIDTDRLYTASEFMELVGSDPGWELIDGRIEPVCAAASNSSLVTTQVSTYLNLYVRTRQIGLVWTAEASFRIEQEPDTVVLPDIAFVGSDRLAAQVPDTFFDGTPDLAVEVRSPSDRMADLHRKMIRYHRAGSQLTWLIDPQHRQVHVRRTAGDIPEVLVEGDTLSGESVIPGLALPVEAIFDTAGPLRPELVLG